MKCPSCGEGAVTAYFQATIEVQPSGKVVVLDEPDTDTFLNAGCSNRDGCGHELRQSPGDGRLRRSSLMIEDHDIEVEDERLRNAWVDVVEDLIKKTRKL